MNKAFSSLFLGITLIYLGIDKQGTGLLISWLGLSFFMTGLGYYGILNDNIYGKDESGQIPYLHFVFHMPFLLYTWSIWYLIQLLSRENAYDRVNEKLIIGRRLFKNECPKDVINYVDLTVEFKESPELVKQHNYIFLPILDGCVPDVENLEKAFNKLGDGLTYIHCAQGHGRTGLFAAMLLSRQGMVENTEEALAMLKKSRPALALSREQKQFLQKYLDN